MSVCSSPLRVQLLQGRDWRSQDFSRLRGPPPCLVVLKKIRSKSLSILSGFEDLQHYWDSLARGLPAWSQAGIGLGTAPQWAVITRAERGYTAPEETAPQPCCSPRLKHRCCWLITSMVINSTLVGCFPEPVFRLWLACSSRELSSPQLGLVPGVWAALSHTSWEDLGSVCGRWCVEARRLLAV